MTPAGQVATVPVWCQTGFDTKFVTSLFPAARSRAGKRLISNGEKDGRRDRFRTYDPHHVKIVTQRAHRPDAARKPFVLGDIRNQPFRVGMMRFGRCSVNARRERA